MQPEQVDGYAAALFEVARAEGALEVVEEELFKLSDVLAQSDELRSTRTDPNIPSDKRQEIIQSLLAMGKATPITTNLVALVVGAGHARELPGIISSLVERAMGDLRARVADMTIELTEKVVQRNLDRETNLALIERFIDEAESAA